MIHRHGPKQRVVMQFGDGDIEMLEVDFEEGEGTKGIAFRDANPAQPLNPNLTIGNYSVAMIFKEPQSVTEVMKVLKAFRDKQWPGYKPV